MSESPFFMRQPDLSDFFGLGVESARYRSDLIDAAMDDFEPATLEDDPAISRLVAVIERQADEFHRYAEMADRSGRNAYHMAIASLVVASLSLVVAAVALVADLL